MTGNILIRQASKADCQPLAAVIAQVITNIPYYNALAKQSEIAKFQPEHLMDKIAADPHSVLVATSGDEIAGFCLSRFDDYLIWLEWFGVADQFRGQGVANLLLQQFDQTITVRQCHKAWCDCRTSNEATIYMLGRHGFRQLATLNNHWYKQDFILWEKWY